MADGGQINWQNENQRRHGKLERPQDSDTLTKLILGTEGQIEKAIGKGPGRDLMREKLRSKFEASREAGDDGP